MKEVAADGQDSDGRRRRRALRGGDPRRMEGRHVPRVERLGGAEPEVRAEAGLELCRLGEPESLAACYRNWLTRFPDADSSEDIRRWLEAR